MEQLIRTEMRVLPVIDVDFEIQRRVEFIQKKLKQSSCKSLVLGISGGVDSTTCGRLAQLAVLFLFLFLRVVLCSRGLCKRFYMFLLCFNAQAPVFHTIS